MQEDGPNVLASVYVEPAGERSAKTGLPMTVILGRVTAHEIGHLLLGTNSHRPSGLMQAKWDLRRPQPAEWQFTSADAEQIRDRLLSRSAEGQVVAGDPIETTRMATTVMSSARPFDPAKSSSAGGTSDR